MTVLSDQDIRKELGRNIYIYPFSDLNLRGASYNLTASHLAWSLKNRDNDNKCKSIFYLKYPVPGTNQIKENVIVIEPGDTGLIETFEAIWISQKISGSYHSKVAYVSCGTGHIGTTLDPTYTGLSLIAIHNHSQENVYLDVSTINDKDEIKFGDSFVTLVFNYLQTPSSQEEKGNQGGRIEILNIIGIVPTKEESSFMNAKFRTEKQALLNHMKKCEDYQSIVNNRSEEKQLSNFNAVQKIILTSIILGICVGIITNIPNIKNVLPKALYDFTNTVLQWTLPSFITFSCTLWYIDKTKK